MSCNDCCTEETPCTECSLRRALERTQSELDKARIALSKINDIRNSIVGLQSFNFSEHAYPLVAALNDAGIAGLPYPEAKANVGTLLSRAEKAEKELEYPRIHASDATSERLVADHEHALRVEAEEQRDAAVRDGNVMREQWDIAKAERDEARNLARQRLSGPALDEDELDELVADAVSDLQQDRADCAKLRVKVARASECIESMIDAYHDEHEGLSEYFEMHGPQHSQEDCPEDDTCDCPESRKLHAAWKRWGCVVTAAYDTLRALKSVLGKDGKR
jgi:hypothetical protein